MDVTGRPKRVTGTAKDRTHPRSKSRAAPDQEALQLLRVIAKNTGLILKVMLEETAKEEQNEAMRAEYLKRLFPGMPTAQPEDPEAQKMADEYVKRRHEEIQDEAISRDEERGYDWPTNPKS